MKPLNYEINFIFLPFLPYHCGKKVNLFMKKNSKRKKSKGRIIKGRKEGRKEIRKEKEEMQL